MPLPLILTLSIDRTQIVTIGRQLTRLYRTTNAAGFRGHNPGALLCSRIEGVPDRKAGTMVYTIELSLQDPPRSIKIPAADWSLFAHAIEQPGAVPYAPNPVPPVITHTPQPPRGE